MSAERQVGHAEARGLYEAIRGLFPRWPRWGDLRLRTRDLLAATVRAIGDDRDRSPRNRPTAAPDGELPYTPGPHTPASPPPAQGAQAARYAAGSEPTKDATTILLAEVGHAPS